ncbi:predicted protein [Uncinocarpus reesii 1704]|uniref:Uncharacterized protein n=1 Tax=Uncinocarpus reesii (strain UAMH 1704) TaxID=336963 RepID=C4JYX8_UNCRE|nr:uncharacterized protein UREG_07379 [Uncinocarpus reesii 1704]EEP82514.1 predicted protein [Uncinocarpus reesii 1704]
MSVNGHVAIIHPSIYVHMRFVESGRTRMKPAGRDSFTCDIFLPGRTVAVQYQQIKRQKQSDMCGRLSGGWPLGAFFPNRSSWEFEIELWWHECVHDTWKFLPPRLFANYKATTGRMEGIGQQLVDPRSSPI